MRGRTAPTPEPVHLPASYPQSITARTRAILSQSAEKSTDRAKCEYIIPELTLLFVEAIQRDELLPARAEPLMNEVLQRLSLMREMSYSLGLDPRVIWESEAWRSFQAATAAEEVGQSRQSTPSGETTSKASTATNASHRPIGRPRKDGERDRVREKKAASKSWKEITAEMNAETGQNKTAEAYRALLKSDSVQK